MIFNKLIFFNNDSLKKLDHKILLKGLFLFISNYVINRFRLSKINNLIAYALYHILNQSLMLVDFFKDPQKFELWIYYRNSSVLTITSVFYI